MLNYLTEIRNIKNGILSTHGQVITLPPQPMTFERWRLEKGILKKDPNYKLLKECWETAMIS